MKICSISGCCKNQKSRGFCSAHYERLRLYGDPEYPLKQRPDGSGHINKKGYVMILHNRKNCQQHRVFAETALGKQLPNGAVVHHANGNRSDNRNSNLVICQDEMYHRLLHIRKEAIEATGNPNHRKCWICTGFDKISKLKAIKQGNKTCYMHHKCDSEYRSYRYANRSQ